MREIWTHAHTQGKLHTARANLLGVQTPAMDAAFAEGQLPAQDIHLYVCTCKFSGSKHLYRKQILNGNRFAECQMPTRCVCIHIYLYVCMYRARSLSLAHTQRKRQRARARASDRVQEKARARERAHMHCAHLLDASLELIEAERVAVAIDRSYALRLHPPTHPATHAHLCVCVCVFVNVRRDMPLSLSFPACSLARARTLICRT